MDFVLDVLKTIKAPEKVIHNPDEHEAIYKAILSREPEKAMNLTKKHVEILTKDMMKLEKEYLKALKGVNPVSLVRE